MYLHGLNSEAKASYYVIPGCHDVPMAVTIVPLFDLMNQLRWLDTYQALIILLQQMPMEYF